MANVKFGTGGFRAVIGEDFTKENVQKICQAVANILLRKNLKKEICVGYDNRFMSENFAIWCSEVFAGNGINVLLLDRATSTPVVMYATLKRGNDFGVMITASHNPYVYNGVKVFTSEGKDAGLEETREIEKEISEIDKVASKPYLEALNKEITLANFLNDYVENILNLLKLDQVDQNMKIVFDAMHGSTVEEIQIMAEKIGLKNYSILSSNRDAFFGFKVTAPNVDNIAQLKQKVVEENAEIGFALDADGDRLAVVDEKGNYIDNNEILAVTYYYLVKCCGKKGDAVKNVATSNLLDKVCEMFGQKCIEVPVGFKYVSSGLRENNAVVGGESSGGLAIHGHIWGKDSLLAIAICIKAISVLKKSFAKILEEVKDFVGGYDKVIADKQYSYTPQQKEFIDKMLFEKKSTPEHRYKLKNTYFGEYIKVYYQNGNWSLIRFSGTEPILRIFAEADSKEETENLISDWEKLLQL